MHPKKIILYGDNFCPCVPPVYAMLKQANADFEYVDIQTNYSARDLIRRINQGHESVPTLVFPDGSTLTEPTSRILKAKLEALGYKVPPSLWLKVFSRVLKLLKREY